jgi:Holliday junction DNA helicase RuvA
MIYSLKGIVTSITETTVVVDVHDVGYEVFVSRPQDFHYGEEAKIFTYEVISQDDHYMVGFATREEKDAFGMLISVKGIGPKTAISALSGTTPEGLFKAIESSNTAFLKKLPGIGPKAASQIILDLKGRLANSDSKGNPHQYDYVRAALIQLGFKATAVDDVLGTINEPLATNDDILRLALQKLSKK